MAQKPKFRLATVHCVLNEVLPPESETTEEMMCENTTLFDLIFAMMSGIIEIVRVLSSYQFSTIYI